MRYRIWRSLDKSASFFGIKGNFMVLFLCTAAAGLIVALIAGKAAGTLPGMAVFALAAAGGYFLVLSVQSKMSDKAFSRSLMKRRYPKFIRITPEAILSTKEEVQS